MAQNKATTDDDIVSILVCADEKLSKVKMKLVIVKNLTTKVADSEQSDVQVAPVVSVWCDVKWQMKIWLLGVPKWHDAHSKC
jgi:hypothetical protein